jgi:hypothetical protein
MRRPCAVATGLAVVLALLGGASTATVRAQAQGGAPPASAREAAPIDLTGYWVAYVTENWRYRMVTPPKGEYRRIPASPAALAVINAWDPAADAKAGLQCRGYGAAAIMSVPARLHVTWQDANTLRVDIDAGTQTRLLRFGAGQTPARPRSWQGDSTAQWERVAGPGGGGSLRVTTANLRAGYLRKNGVPYSERATMTEHMDLTPLPDGGQLLLVTTIVEDPVYLTGPYIVSPHFKREADGSKWNPTPCSSTW